MIWHIRNTGVRISVCVDVHRVAFHTSASKKQFPVCITWAPRNPMPEFMVVWYFAISIILPLLLYTNFRPYLISIHKLPIAIIRIRIDVLLEMPWDDSEWKLVCFVLLSSSVHYSTEGSWGPPTFLVRSCMNLFCHSPYIRGLKRLRILGN